MFQNEEVLIDAIVKALEQYDTTKQQREVKRSILWQILEWICISIFFCVLIWICVTRIQVYEDSYVRYSFIEIVRIVINVEKTNVSGFTDSYHNNMMATFYSTIAGGAATLILLVLLWVGTMIGVRRHTRRDVREIITFFTTIVIAFISLCGVSLFQ